MSVESWWRAGSAFGGLHLRKGKFYNLVEIIREAESILPDYDMMKSKDRAAFGRVMRKALGRTIGGVRLHASGAGSNAGFTFEVGDDWDFRDDTVADYKAKLFKPS